jgi:Secretion system C-terminal sorting domain
MRFTLNCFIICVLLASLTAIATAEPVHSVPEGRFYITAGEHQICVPYLSNRPIDETHLDRDRCVISLPGGSRDIEQVAEWVQAGAYSAGALPTTLLVGIQFLLETDVDAHFLDDDVAFWDHMAWYVGELSDSSDHNPRAARASSYTFMDSLVYTIARANPHFDAIVITGPSAGAKYAQRYAASTRVEQLLASENLPPMIHITVNNGSFVYLNDRRRCVDGDFAVPDQVMQGFIPRFNSHPYGMVEANEYMMTTGVENIISQYRDRWVYYIIGSLDDGPNSDNQPMGMQGWNNIQRNVFFFEHLVDEYGGANLNHELIVIEGADHHEEEILQDPLTWEPMFYFIPTVTSVDEGSTVGSPSELPTVASLDVYPNPFNSSTSLAVSLPLSGNLKVEVFNVAGQRVSTLHDDWSPSGRQTFTFAPFNQSSGIYFVHVTARGQLSEVRKITLMK